MKLIVCGGRRFNDESQLARCLKSIDGITEIVQGGALGADHLAWRHAVKNGIACKTFEADWSHYGKSAGPVRNERMACYADACAVFDGGKGTADMLRRAQEKGLKIYDFRTTKGSN